MFPHLGLKHFLPQMWGRQIRVTNACVCAHTCIFLSVCVCENGLESVIMRIISQSWERAVPGHHTQASSRTSTGRTGGPGSGDYSSDEVGTGTRSVVRPKHTHKNHLSAQVRFSMEAADYNIMANRQWKWRMLKKTNSLDKFLTYYNRKMLILPESAIGRQREASTSARASVL